MGRACGICAAKALRVAKQRTANGTRNAGGHRWSLSEEPRCPNGRLRKWRCAGYISGGCLEAALVLEAQLAMRERKNRLTRYGKGSKYIDVVLPCGSGLDIYFDQAPPLELTGQAIQLLHARNTVAWRTDLPSGRSTLHPYGPHEIPPAKREGDAFVRSYLPAVRLVIAGAGPAVLLLARLAQTAGLEVEAFSPEAGLVAEARRHGIEAHAAVKGKPLPGLKLDSWTAGVLLFHDHDWEAPFWTRCWPVPAFTSVPLEATKPMSAGQKYSKKGMGARCHRTPQGPAGLIAHAKQPHVLALSILAEIMTASKGSGHSLTQTLWKPEPQAAAGNVLLRPSKPFSCKDCRQGMRQGET